MILHERVCVEESIRNIILTEIQFAALHSKNVCPTELW